ncbi:MAG: imidazole glycerol phosphate synthase subunit HisH [Zetaproteobacteria bacterium]|nr:MAG: imidazole glycerol phosphate synthase subunit HisH [Zetaproteobacteria bacterium]
MSGVIALIDYGMGNLHSVEKALARVGGRVVRVRDPEEVRTAERVVLPGVGAFADCMQTLRARGLDEAVRESIHAGKPYLGICLGMQILFARSHEFGLHEGLRLAAGDVVPFPEDFPSRGLKIPHMGWNDCVLACPHPVLSALGDRQVYYVHSFYCAPEEERLVAGWCDYGPVRFAAAVAWENVVGVQFHPEKSQRAGLAMLEAFVRWRP